MYAYVRIYVCMYVCICMTKRGLEGDMDAGRERERETVRKKGHGGVSCL